MGLDKHIPQSYGTILGHGQTNVTTAGIAIILLASADTIGVLIKAKSTNNGMIYVGDSDVTSSTGYILDAAETVSISLDHASDNIYINADTSSEGVSYLTIV